MGLDVNVYAMEEQALMITVGIALPHIEGLGELFIPKLLQGMNIYFAEYDMIYRIY